MDIMKRWIGFAAAVAVLVVSYSLLVRASLPQVPSNTWAATGDMAQARAGASAVLLLDGRLLITGGTDDAGVTAPRTGHGADLLYDGTVIIAGGFDGTSVLMSIDLFDPYAESVSAGPSLATGRAGHSVTRLLDGKVLVAGGAGDSTELASAEV